MNSSSKSLVLLVAGATTVAAALGVTLGVIQSPKEQPTVSDRPIAPTATLPQTPSPLASSIAPTTATPSPSSPPANSAKPASPLASVAPQRKETTEKTLQTELCTKPNMAIVNDPNPPLNVRSSPSVNSDNIVGRLPNGTLVSVVSDRNGWFQINNPVAGWVAKNRTRSSCTQMRVRISFSSDRNSTTVSDRIVGSGEHKYLLRLPKGQSLSVTSNQGPFPTIIAPNGKILAGNPYTDSDRSQWTGSLPASGDYTLQFESNGAGFQYSFLVQVK